MSKSKEDKLYCIYMHTSPSGKSYIGQTSNYEKRCIQHKKENSGCTAFRDSIKKYGWDAFNHEILLDDLTVDEANRFEQLCISEFDTLYPNGYNLKDGGANGNHSVETKILQSEKRLAYWESKSEHEKSEIQAKRLMTLNNKSEHEKQISIDKFKSSMFNKSKGELDEIYDKIKTTFKNKSDSDKEDIKIKRATTRKLKIYGTLDEEIIKLIKKEKNRLQAKKRRAEIPEKYREYDRTRYHAKKLNQQVEKEQ